eukprot:CAMPEP_0197295032 /NCGR_PEP_ID=MMETSP0890-20130614/34239_1 /TAXON_ID=44058 ORGANISM="Aureoumbra lagunensis, Strain CCMP1510" /NCGR_SAMPLE_ID=MMETSP0890 /ASSEMBLY_ACC=CAM_ASM_000533 /LENGTH=301 /DNA_ID=CAMNT_0042770761 /DNA_START=196 /DNA_END=1098 /DNA_ORIENTATION=+
MFENRGDNLHNSNSGDMNDTTGMMSVMTWDGRQVYYGENAESYRGDIPPSMYYDFLGRMFEHSDEKPIKVRVMNPPLPKPPPAPNIHTKYYDNGESDDDEVNYDTNGGVHDIYRNISIPSFNGEPPTLGDPPPAPTLPVLDDPAVFSYYIPGCGYVSRADQTYWYRERGFRSLHKVDYSVTAISDEVFLSLPIVKEVWHSNNYTDYLRENADKFMDEVWRITTERFKETSYTSFLSSTKASNAPLIPTPDGSNPPLRAVDPDTIDELDSLDQSSKYPYRLRSWHQILSPAEYGEINTRLAW